MYVSALLPLFVLQIVWKGFKTGLWLIRKMSLQFLAPQSSVWEPWCKMIFYMPGWNYEFCCVFFFLINVSPQTIPLKSQHSFTVRMNREGKKYTTDSHRTLYNLIDEVKLSRSSVNKFTGSRCVWGKNHMRKPRSERAGFRL